MDQLRRHHSDGIHLILVDRVEYPPNAIRHE